MTIDFRASQFRGAKFIASGSTGTGASLVFYPISADSTTNPNSGNINTAKFNTSAIGTDVFLFVSGGVGQKGTSATHAISVFGGDLHVSGNLTIGGSGGGGTNYWFSTSSNAIFTTGSVDLSGSITFNTSSVKNTPLHIQVLNGFNGLAASSDNWGLSISAGSPIVSGSGGAININAGNSGESDSQQSGGDVNIVAGNGTATIFNPSAGNQSGGGNLVLGAGTGGNTLLQNYAGNGGVVAIYGGPGGINANQATPIAAGNGGELYINGGPGGSGLTNAAAGGGGGSLFFEAGTGGNGGGPGGTGGSGGIIQLIAGPAGSRGDDDSVDGDPGYIQIISGDAPGGTPVGKAGRIMILGGAASPATSENDWPTTGSNVQIGSSSKVGGKIGRFFVNADITPGVEAPQFFPGLDVFAYISGTVGARNTVSGGTIVLGGDTFVSGNMYVSRSLYVGEFRNNNAISTNVFYVSGTVNKIPQGSNQRNAVFNSDMVISGTVLFRSSSACPVNFLIGGNSDSGLVFSGSLLTMGVAGNTNAGHESVFQVTSLGGAGQVPAVVNKDVIFVVSGNVDGQGQSGGGVSLFRGDVVVSGNLYFGAGKKFKHFITIGSYATTTLTSSNPQVAGQAVLSQSEIPSSSIILRSVLSTTTGSVSASLKLFNVTSGSYVEIGGTGITTLGTVSTTPTQIQSVNLFSATNFGTGSNIYEVQLYIGTGSQQAVLGSSMFVCS